MIPEEIKNRILDLAQVEEVVGDFVSLKRAGSVYKACCPFHNEKTPSFVVSPSKGIYKCFGCGKAGTAVGFVMEHESMTYVEALKYLGKKYGIEVVDKDESPEDNARRQRSESLYLVSDFAARFFVDSMQTPDGQTIAYQYFRSRGLEDETIRKYGLGWAPVGRKALLEAARAAGYKEEYLIDTGLCKVYDDGRVVDNFSDRVMFPIHSHSGRVIAFGGRTLRSDVPAKYVNSKETEIYVKSRSLYGIYFAKSEIARQDRCILVEGYLDVLSMHQLGITNVVASSGTSLTVDQIRLIRKFTHNVTIIYDGDSAGIKAALRGIGLVLKEGLSVKIVLLPEGQDPDDFARRHSLEEVRDYIAHNEQDFIGFKTDLLLGEAGDDPLKRANLINDIADTIALIPDAVTRAVYARSTAARFDIDENILVSRVSRSREEMIVADRQQQRQIQDRELRQREMQAPEEQGYGEDRVPVQPPVYQDEGPLAGLGMDEPLLVPCEKDLLQFILEEGQTDLEFDRDSRYYVEGERVNVAEFIDATLADDEAEFVNEPFRKVYEEYFRLYDEGLDQKQIQTRMLNSEDSVIAEITKELIIAKYELTVKNYEQSLTAVATVLVQFVPKAILTYNLKKVEVKLRQLTDQLTRETDEERQLELISTISTYTRARTRLSNELGRV